MDYLNPIAEIDRIDSGELITPDKAHALKGNRHFYCPDYDCKDPDRVLIPVISGKGNYFFRHRGNFKHDIRPETLLHKSAIKWFVDRVQYEIPEATLETCSLQRQSIELDPTQTVCEFRRLQTIIPDVKITSIKGFEFAIEIVVTNDLHDSKKKLIEQFGIPVIRVDLSKFYKKHKKECQVDKEFIDSNLDKLMTDIKLKSWVVPPSIEFAQSKLNWTPIEKKSEPVSANNDVGCFLAILTVGLIYLFRRK